MGSTGKLKTREVQVLPTLEVEAGGIRTSRKIQLHSKFKASLGYMVKTELGGEGRE